MYIYRYISKYCLVNSSHLMAVNLLILQLFIGKLSEEEL